MTQIVSSSAEDALLNWQAMADMFSDRKCWLVMLDDWQISLILTLLRYAHWSRRWLNYNDDWDSVDMSVCQVEACLMSGCDVSELNANLDEIVDKLTDVATAIGNLVVNVSAPMIVNCMTQGTGDDAPSGLADEEEDPPAGWLPGNPEIEDRKCKVANYIYDNLYSIMTKFDEYNVESLASLGAGLVIGSVSLILATVVTGPLAVMLSIVGLTAALVLALLVEGIDLAGLITILEERQADLVCALYSSSTSSEAREAVSYVLDYSGANTSQIVLIETILCNDVVNSLYFKKDDEHGQSLETALETYEGSIDCGEECGECPPQIMENGTLTSGTWQDGYYASAPSGALHLVTFYINSNNPNYGFSCGPYRPFTVLETAGMTRAVHKYFRIFGDDYPNMIYNSDDEPDAVCGRALALTSATSFTAHILVGDNC